MAAGLLAVARHTRIGTLPRPGAPWRRQPAPFCRLADWLLENGLMDGPEVKDRTFLSFVEGMAEGRRR